MTGRAGQAAGRRGFTLVEMLVAMAIASIVVLATHALFAATARESARLEAHRTRLDRQINAMRWLADAFGALDVGQDEPGPFVGAAHEVAFSSRLLVAEGWAEPERIEIALRDGQLVARLRPGPELVVADSVARVEFDYLIERGEAAPWLSGWVSSVNPPLAIRMRAWRATGPSGAGAEVDTTLFLVGSRG